MNEAHRDGVLAGGGGSGAVVAGRGLNGRPFDRAHQEEPVAAPPRRTAGDTRRYTCRGATHAARVASECPIKAT